MLIGTGVLLLGILLAGIAGALVHGNTKAFWESVGVLLAISGGILIGAVATPTEWSEKLQNFHKPPHEVVIDDIEWFKDAEFVNFPTPTEEGARWVFSKTEAITDIGDFVRGNKHEVDTSTDEGYVHMEFRDGVQTAKVKIKRSKDEAPKPTPTPTVTPTVPPVVPPTVPPVVPPTVPPVVPPTVPPVVPPTVPPVVPPVGPLRLSDCLKKPPNVIGPRFNFHTINRGVSIYCSPHWFYKFFYLRSSSCWKFCY